MVTTNRTPSQQQRVHSHDRSTARPEPSPADEVSSHRVKKGETLTSIARDHGCTVDELRELNPTLRGDKILAGQRLEVMKVDAPAARRPVDADTQRAARTRASSTDAAMRQRLDKPFSVDGPSIAEIKGGEVMKRGMGGAHVKEVQRKLGKHGADIEADGKFGPRTQAAVRELQGDHKLPQSGKVDAKLLDALERAKPKPDRAPRADRDRNVDAPGDASLGPSKKATAYVNGVPRTIRVVEVEGKLVEVKQAQRFLEMKGAAAKDGVDLNIVSGFRTMAEQRRLYEGWVARRPGFNPANPPGFSNHQNGTALDLNTQGPSDSRGSGKVYNWLAKNGAKFDFARIPSEHWHWEYRGR